MKILRVLVALVMIHFFTGLGAADAETIYTKDGEAIQAMVSEKTETVIWYEVLAGDIGKYIGINISEIDKILNDDGSISEYSPVRAEVTE